MNTSFKTTIEDVVIAAQQLNVIITEEMAKELLDELDTDLIEDAALSAESFYEEGDDEFDGDMQEQVDAAMEEIRSQLQENQLFLAMKNK
jgi:hypothetical protein